MEEQSSEEVAISPGRFLKEKLGGFYKDCFFKGEASLSELRVIKLEAGKLYNEYLDFLEDFYYNNKREDGVDKIFKEIRHIMGGQLGFILDVFQNKKDIYQSRWDVLRYMQNYFEEHVDENAKGFLEIEGVDHEDVQVDPDQIFFKEFYRIKFGKDVSTSVELSLFRYRTISGEESINRYGEVVDHRPQDININFETGEGEASLHFATINEEKESAYDFESRLEQDILKEHLEKAVDFLRGLEVGIHALQDSKD